MRRSEISNIPPYFKRYVDTIPPEMELNKALKEYGIPYLQKELSQYESLGEQVYAPGKWTIRQILIHLIDTERIFTYRALRFARGDAQPLPGMEQDGFVANANVAHRSIGDLFDEFTTVRKATISLFRSFEEEHWHMSGVASGMKVSVGALGFMICGHVCHHQKVLERLYYPLLNH